jgi:hypothetical protein
MALKPPGRGGSNSVISQGIDRRRSRRSELLIEQTYGGAAGAVLADRVFATAPTIHSGSVTGSSTSSGTATGTAGRAGSVAGSATSSGSVTGTKGATGSIAGESVATGTVTGTNSEAPVAPPSGGGGAYNPRGPLFTYAKPEPARVKATRRRGGASGLSLTPRALVVGTASRSGATGGQSSAHAGTVTGHASRTGSTAISTSRTETTHTRGRAAWLIDQDDVRRTREDHELLLLV